MRRLQITALVLAVVFLVVLLSKPINTHEPVEQIQKPETKKELPQEEKKPPLATVEEAVKKIERQPLKENVELLASDKFEGRMSGKNGNKLAASHVKKNFESIGLPTEYHKFSIRRTNPGPNNEVGDAFSQNVYAWIEGSDENLKDEVVVIGAHMDHIGYGPSMSRWGGGKIHPGADDNATGTAALMEIARAFKYLEGQNKRTVIFMAFSGEEMGLLGSYHYVNNPLFPKGNPDITKHVFMLNMDMIGYLNQGKTVAFETNESSPDIGSAINELSKKYAFAKTVTLRGASGSDHAPFYNKKVPVAFLHTGLHPYYHTPKDTPDKINYEGLEKVTKYGFELAWNVCNADKKPAFDYGSFKEMDYSHDHGQKDMQFGDKP